MGGICVSVCRDSWNATCLFTIQHFHLSANWMHGKHNMRKDIVHKIVDRQRRNYKMMFTMRQMRIFILIHFLSMQCNCIAWFLLPQWKLSGRHRICVRVSVFSFVFFLHPHDVYFPKIAHTERKNMNNSCQNKENVADISEERRSNQQRLNDYVLSNTC